MKITPLHDFIHIRKPRPETTLPSGIVLPKEDALSKFQGVALAIGPEVKAVKVGDTIIYKQFSSHKVVDAENEYLVSEGDVTAVKE